MINNNKDIGLKIKIARIQKGYKTIELAKLMSVSPSSITKMESGNTSLDNHVEKINEILDLDIKIEPRKKSKQAKLEQVIVLDDNCTIVRKDYLKLLLETKNEKTNTCFELEKEVKELKNTLLNLQKENTYYKCLVKELKLG